MAQEIISSTGNLMLYIVGAAFLIWLAYDQGVIGTKRQYGRYKPVGANMLNAELADGSFDKISHTIDDFKNKRILVFFKRIKNPLTNKPASVPVPYEIWDAAVKDSRAAIAGGALKDTTIRLPISITGEIIENSETSAEIKALREENRSHRLEAATEKAEKEGLFEQEDDRFARAVDKTDRVADIAEKLTQFDRRASRRRGGTEMEL